MGSTKTNEDREMSEANFTKGEWISGMHDIKDAEGYNVECDSDCGWSYIGTKNKCIAMAVTKSHLDDELDANTALIEAAPLLYELLEQIANEAGYYESRTGAVVTWREKADRLLAKARGEK